LEDSGGIGGYHELLDTLADPGQEEHRDLHAWVARTAGPWHEFGTRRPRRATPSCKAKFQ
jgi:hypothetical protein